MLAVSCRQGFWAFCVLGLIAGGCENSGSTDQPFLGAGTGGLPAAGTGAPGTAGMTSIPTGAAGTSATAGTGVAAGSSAAGSGTAGQASAGTGAAGGGTAGMASAGTGAAGSGGSAGTGGPAAGSGATDGLDAKPPFVANGMPIMAPDNAWTWVAFSDTKCRSGMPAGISVNMNSASNNVMIYLEGGGACFDAQTCGANPDAVGAQNPGSGGIFDRSRAENPVKDWNFVYVPYCTGDVHMGANDAGMVEGVPGTQYFVGRANLTAFLHRIIPTFEDAQKVLLTGVSAGGFGASSNAAFVQYAFGDTPVTMIDDSGPTFSNEFLPECLTDAYVRVWGLQKSILDDCGSSCSAEADYSVQFLEYTAKRAAGRYSGLISSDADTVIRGFYGIGTNNGADDCAGILLLTPMTEADFLAGLLDYRERVKAYPGLGTFYPSSTQHTWLGGAGFYTATAGSVKMVDWVKGILDGQPAVHAGH